jgi:hypothetical protein
MLLARTLSRTVRELLASLSAEELTEWIAEYELEPWGELRGDLQMATVAAATTNAWLKKADRVKPSTFLFDFPIRPPRPQTMKEGLRAGLAWVIANGGKIVGTPQF